MGGKTYRVTVEEVQPKPKDDLEVEFDGDEPDKPPDYTEQALKIIQVLGGMIYMGVQLDIVCNLAKDLVKAIENTNEEAIFVFDNSGLFVRMSDIYKYKVLEIDVNKEDFISYECDSPVELGIVVSRIKDVTKTLRKGDFLSIHYEDGADVLNLSANIKLLI